MRLCLIEIDEVSIWRMMAGGQMNREHTAGGSRSVASMKAGRTTRVGLASVLEAAELPVLQKDSVQHDTHEYICQQTYVCM